MTGVVALASGGLDSFLAWGVMPHARNVYVRLGHKYEAKEIAALAAISKLVPDFNFTIIQGPDIGQFELEPSGIIPYRNAELILTAAQYGNEIILGVVKDEINSDKSEHFFRIMELLLNESMLAQYWNMDKGKNHKVYSPLRRFTKSEALKQFLTNWKAGKEEAKKIVAVTVSCYSSHPLQCWNCPSCFKRFVAFINNDIQVERAEESKLVTILMEGWARNKGIFDKCNDGTYSRSRAFEIISAMRKIGVEL